MRFFKMCVLTVALSVAGAGSAVAQTASDLGGVWQGFYWGGGNTQTSFQVTLRDDPGPGVSGTILETNSFGDKTSAFLLSSFQGEVSGEAVTWVKTYDGTGGQAHSVIYSGRLASPRRIVGTWTLDSGVGGEFEIVR